jgi:transcriptional regulator with PAS, ATPase and Fis domain
MSDTTESRQLFLHGFSSHPVPFAHLVNRIPYSVALLNTSRRVVFMNRAMEALSGFSLQDVQGLPCRHVFRSSLCGQKCPLRDMHVDTEPVCREGDIIERNRERVPLRISFSPVKDEQGDLAGWMECFEDLRSARGGESISGDAYSFGPLIGHSPQMEHIFQMLPGIAHTDSSVLITGETGTGKDVLAEMVHQHSERTKGSFVKVNCGALPESLLESELFGHRKGAFTGATENKPGRFKLAHNGTLFLTEIGDLPLTLQVKLLSFLDDHIVYPLGSTKGVYVDARIIAATHCNLQAMVQEGRFRQDLYFRLNVVRMRLPPLREREGDVDLLLDHFLAVFSQRFQKEIKKFSRECRDFLLRYPYPGNVRELRNIVEFAVNICRGAMIEPDHLPVYIFERLPDLEKPRHEEEGPGRAEHNLAPPPSPDASWPEIERQMIVNALYNSGGRKNRAAEILGWGRSTLWRKMKQYGIN